MRILHVGSGNLYGGVETLLVSLAANRGLCPVMEPSFALSFPGRLRSELAELGVQLFDLGPIRSSRIGSVLRARRALRELQREEKFDWILFHSYWAFSLLSTAISRKSVRKALWHHGEVRGWKLLARLSRPDVVICNSRYSLTVIPPGYARRDTAVVYGPLVIPVSHLSEDERRKVRSELQTDPAATVILQVSRIEALKGHRLHLRALQKLKHGSNWVLWVAGGAQRPHEIEYLKELQQTAKDYGIGDRVHFLGQRSDVSRLLNAADIFCQPNESPEAFGMTFIEALGAGLPVVTTAIGAAPEIISEQCGLLSKPDDEDDLAAKLQLLLENEPLRKAKGAAGMKRAVEICDPAERLHDLHALLARNS